MVKRGVQDKVQIYWCKECNIRFRNKRRKDKRLSDKVWFDYVFHKQTVRELADEYERDDKTIALLLHSQAVPEKAHSPRPIHLIVDTTFFGKRKDGSSWGVTLFRDFDQKENLWWSFVDTETKDVYLRGRIVLESLGYQILSVTADGFGGVAKVFEDLPFQLCQFHMMKTVTKYITTKPLTEAGQVFRALIKTLPYTDKKIFEKRFSWFLMKYFAFLNEKTWSNETGTYSYTHEKLRRAVFSVQRGLPYLFTYEKDGKIPKTTNSAESHFSHLKDVLRIHRGLSRAMKQKVIQTIFLASTIAPKRKKGG